MVGGQAKGRSAMEDAGVRRGKAFGRAGWRGQSFELIARWALRVDGLLTLAAHAIAVVVMKAHM